MGVYDEQLMVSHATPPPPPPQTPPRSWVSRFHDLVARGNIDVNTDTEWVAATQRALRAADVRHQYRLLVPKKMTTKGRARSKHFFEVYISFAASAMLSFNATARTAAETEAAAVAKDELRGVGGMKRAALQAAATAAGMDPNQPVGTLKSLLKILYASKRYRDELADKMYQPMRAWGGFEQAFDCELGTDIYVPFGLSYIVPGDAYVERRRGESRRRRKRKGVA